jgi:von Willebrand factor type A domain
MKAVARFCALGAVLTAALPAQVVFRSDVSLVRVDAQVIDRSHQAITGLTAEDFILREQGQPQVIRHFSAEEMPVDVVLLLDVSGSMRPHVERIASAAHTALRVLGEGDRVAIMVFDRQSRIRMPFKRSYDDIQRGLQAVLEDEDFNGGTDINRGLLDAIQYVSRDARKDARRAIVILTDDQTERDRDEEGISRALARADTVLSALLAPNAIRSLGGRSGPWGWPGGGGMGGPLGDIILGRRGGGRGYPPPVSTRGRTQSAGSAEIARASGGDSFPVEDAGALQTTLERIRQRYALHFHLPEGVRPGEERQIEVELSAAARRRYPGAEVRFRRVYMAPGSREAPSSSPEPIVVSSAPAAKPQPEPAPSPAPTPTPERRGGWRRVGEPPASNPGPITPAPHPGGWRQARAGEP